MNGIPEYRRAGFESQEDYDKACRALDLAWVWLALFGVIALIALVTGGPARQRSALPSARGAKHAKTDLNENGGLRWEGK